MIRSGLSIKGPKTNARGRPIWICWAHSLLIYCQNPLTSCCYGNSSLGHIANICTIQSCYFVHQLSSYTYLLVSEICLINGGNVFFLRKMIFHKAKAACLLSTARLISQYFVYFSGGNILEQTITAAPFSLSQFEEPREFLLLGLSFFNGIVCAEFTLKWWVTVGFTCAETVQCARCILLVMKFPACRNDKRIPVLVLKQIGIFCQNSCEVTLWTAQLCFPAVHESMWRRYSAFDNRCRQRATEVIRLVWQSMATKNKISRRQ